MMRVSAIRRWSIAVLLGIVASGLASRASAQDLETQQVNSDDEGDHALVLEFGAAGDWSRAEGFHPGGTIAFEVTPIEHWLELEIGFAAIRADASTEMPFDVLFKKPWRISRQVELMIGVGPEIVHATGPDRATFWGLSSVVDLMFWPRKNVGWYAEPGYEVTFRGGTTHHGLGIEAGLLIGR
jgi:hypothetical protein